MLIRTFLLAVAAFVGGGIRCLRACSEAARQLVAIETGHRFTAYLTDVDWFDLLLELLGEAFWELIKQAFAAAFRK